MSARRRTFLLATTASAALLLLCGWAAAFSRLPTGSTRYVRIVRLHDGRVSVALTLAGRRRFRDAMRGGMALDATCTKLGRSVQGFSERSSSESAEGGPGSYHPLLDRHADFCDVGRVHLTITRDGESASSVSGPPLDSIALTQRGAAYLEEDRLTAMSLAVLNFAIGEAQLRPDGHFPTAQQVVSAIGRRMRIVALASPADTPLPGQIGFYSDTADHAEVVQVSTLGRRIFMDSRDGVLSTNVAEHLSRPIMPL